MREKLAWRWLGAHAVALGVSSTLMGPLQAGWKVHFGEEGLGFAVFYVLLACGTLAYAQAKVPRVRRFPVSFWVWGLASSLSSVIAFLAAFSSVAGWTDLAKGWCPDSIFLSLAGALLVPLISYALVNAMTQGFVLYWKTRHGSAWLWTVGLTIGELFGVLLSLLRVFLANGWVDSPGARSLILLVIGAFHGALLGLATLFPLRRILARPE